MKRFNSVIAAFMLAGMLAACGDGADGPAPVVPGTQQAAQVRCPAKIESPPRAANAPVDDVVDVRPGLTLDEARRVVQCHQEGIIIVDARSAFNINTYGQTLRWGFEAQTRRPLETATGEAPTSEELTSFLQREEYRVSSGGGLQPGEERLRVVAIGLPSQERVYGVWREQRYAEDAQPTIATITAALNEKYGPPSQASETDMLWVYDTLGRKLTDTSPIYASCARNIRANMNSSFQMSPDCGLIISTRINPVRENPGLTQTLQVGLLNQAAAYQALESTEVALLQADQERRAQELERAQQNGVTPDL